MRLALHGAAAALAAVALVACVGDQRETEADAPVPAGPRADVFAELRALPGSRVLDTTGTADAQRYELLTPESLDSVHAFYRGVLSRDGWRIVSDVVEGAGLTMHARRDTLLAWLMAARESNGFTRYTLIGAVARPDSTRPPPEMMPRRP